MRYADESCEIQQVMVLTHNLEFLKQVAPHQRRKDTHNWRLVKRGNVSQVIDYGDKRPVNSGYEQLWEELQDACQTFDSTRLPNLMRNIIETYFLKFGGYNKQKLYSGGYMTTPEEKTAI